MTQNMIAGFKGKNLNINNANAQADITVETMNIEIKFHIQSEYNPENFYRVLIMFKRKHVNFLLQ